ncbi:hypothetical protein I3A86_25735, partial [Salmonella enterica]|nr:hypothetical protein [Salmonella enterica]
MRRAVLTCAWAFALMSFGTAEEQPTIDAQRQADRLRVPFDFKADKFEGVMLHVSELYGRGVWPRLDGCRDETRDRPGFCSYQLSSAISIVVVDAFGKDQPH